MTISTLGQELKIICGVPRAPGDTASAEDALQILDLLAGTKGFSVEPGGWIPQLPQVKNGGLWADSGVADGRTLIAAPVGNVTENISLTSNAATLQGRYYWEKELSRFSKLCADFWQTFGQIQPVYLKWWAPDAPGPQYALLYKIELAARSDPFSGDSVQEMVVSVEREPYWRFLAPGSNPKLYTFEARKQSFALTDLDFFSGNTDLIYNTNIANKFEWAAAVNPGEQNTPLTQNYVDIPADSVPGDMPALLELAIINNSSSELGKLWIARSSKLLTRTNHAGEVKANAYNLAAGDAALTVGWTKVVGTAATGLRSNNSNVDYTYAEYIWAGAGLAPLVQFGNNGTTSSIILLDRSLLRGRFALFLRGGTTTGATGDVLIQQVNVFADENASPEYLPEVQFLNTPVKTYAAGTDYPLNYIGILTLPFNAKTAMSTKGYGQQIREDPTGNIMIIILFQNTKAAARTIRWIDLILLPIDEGLMQINFPTPNVVAGGPTKVLLDHTGYMGHGQDISTADAYLTSATSGGAPCEVIGPPITLEPGINQRLYFLAAKRVGVDEANPNETLIVRGNIIPRCSGARSE